VGPVLVQRLYWYVEQSRHGLTALRKATIHVKGIDARHQGALNVRVKRYEVQRSSLLLSNFPGTAEIERKYTEGYRKVCSKIETLTSQEKALTQEITYLETRIEPLKQVRPRHFYRALDRVD